MAANREDRVVTLVSSDFFANYGSRLTVRNLIRAATQGSFMAQVLYRLSHASFKSGWINTAHALKLLNRLLFEVEISPSAKIGNRLVIGHGMGLVIGGSVVIGDDCFLGQGVTLGSNIDKKLYIDGKEISQPVVGSECWLLAGSVVVGPIKVGDGVIVGANSVVTHDLAEWSTYAGAPARRVGPNSRRRRIETVKAASPRSTMSMLRRPKIPAS